MRFILVVTGFACDISSCQDTEKNFNNSVHFICKALGIFLCKTLPAELNVILLMFLYGKQNTVIFVLDDHLIVHSSAERVFIQGSFYSASACNILSVHHSWITNFVPKGGKFAKSGQWLVKKFGDDKVFFDKKSFSQHKFLLHMCI